MCRYECVYVPELLLCMSVKFDEKLKDIRFLGIKKKKRWLDQDATTIVILPFSPLS